MQSDMPDSPTRTLITFLKAIVNLTFQEILISHYVVRGSHRNCRFAAIIVTWTQWDEGRSIGRNGIINQGKHCRKNTGTFRLWHQDSANKLLDCDTYNGARAENQPEMQNPDQKQKNHKLVNYSNVFAKMKKSKFLVRGMLGVIFSCSVAPCGACTSFFVTTVQ